MNNVNKKIIEKINEVPTISGNTLKILNIISKGDYDISELIKLVSMDITLSTKLFKLVNSAEFGFSGHIKSLNRAVTYIGSKTITAIIINNNFNRLYSSSLDGYYAEAGDLWNHSLRTAIAAKLIAQDISYYTDIAYTAGLFHDLGKVILNEFLKKFFDKKDINKLSIGKKRDFIKAERDILNTDHSEIGQLMASRWKFPESLQMAIRYHHNPSLASKRHIKLAMIVHLADIMAMMAGFGTGYDSLAYRLDKLAEEFIRIDRNSIEKILLETDTEFEKLKSCILQTTGDNNA